ncbi:MAG: HD domain-containing protein [Myxococcaceae bacterium]|nr:HD domain-containing protein [Myxococcaceae bacterium]
MATLADVKIPESVFRVLARLKERGFEAYLVGGCVRDMVRGATPKDFDIATSARPEEVQRSFPKTIPTGVEHGTVTVLSQGTPVEVTTFRTEGAYLDARRPSTVSFHTNIEEDLSRRDFTINAMAWDPVSSKLVDPFGGEADIGRRLIRCVGAPELRFAEDGLRALRAVRFAAVLGFEIDPATEAAIPPTLPSFRRIALERVREEFTRLLLSDRPVVGLELLQRTGLLGAFLPEIERCVGVAQNPTYGGDVFSHVVATVGASPPVLEVRLCALLHDVAKPRTAPSFEGHDRLGEQLTREILMRLKFPTKVIDATAHLVREHLLDESARWTDAALRRFVARMGEPMLEPFFAYLEADRSTRVDGKERRAKVKALYARIEDLLAQRPPLNAKALALNGTQIMKVLGIGPSPAVGEATRFLLEQVLEDPTLNTEPALTKALRSWAREKGL